jgi:hypothetical protein
MTMEIDAATTYANSESLALGLELPLKSITLNMKGAGRIGWWKRFSADVPLAAIGAK